LRKSKMNDAVEESKEVKDDFAETKWEDLFEEGFEIIPHDLDFFDEFDPSIEEFEESAKIDKKLKGIRKKLPEVHAHLAYLGTGDNQLDESASFINDGADLDNYCSSIIEEMENKEPQVNADGAIDILKPAISTSLKKLASRRGLVCDTACETKFSGRKERDKRKSDVCDLIKKALFYFLKDFIEQMITIADHRHGCYTHDLPKKSGKITMDCKDLIATLKYTKLFDSILPKITNMLEMSDSARTAGLHGGNDSSAPKKRKRL